MASTWSDDDKAAEEISTVVTNATTATSKSQQKRAKRKNRKSSKSQHSLDHMRQRVSELYSVFETNGWFVPLPDPTSNKVWSNRNYGADKKRQRKHQERHLLESRVAQLETVLREEHSWFGPSSVIEEE